MTAIYPAKDHDFFSGVLVVLNGEDHLLAKHIIVSMAFVLSISQIRQAVPSESVTAA